MRKTDWDADSARYVEDNYLDKTDKEIAEVLTKYNSAGIIFKTNDINKFRNDRGLFRVALIGNEVVAAAKLRKIDINGVNYSIAWQKVETESSPVFIMCVVEKPHYITVGTTYTGAEKQMCKLLRSYNETGRRDQFVDWGLIKRIRELAHEGKTCEDISKEFNLTKDFVRKVVCNMAWREADYMAPGRSKPVNSIIITIGDESKSTAEWIADGRCEIGSEELRQRWKRGERGESILKRRKKK